jgi:phage head maturation protease
VHISCTRTLQAAGLVGTIRLARTRLADEALELACEDLLGASDGFQVPSQGEQWHGSTRRIRKATLHHIALTPIPAYDGRSSPSAAACSLAPADLGCGQARWWERVPAT